MNFGEKFRYSIFSPFSTMVQEKMDEDGPISTRFDFPGEIPHLCGSEPISIKGVERSRSPEPSKTSWCWTKMQEDRHTLVLHPTQ